MFETFVGRKEELKRLECSLQTAISGEQHIVFVAGDAGMGKTSLIQYFRQQAQQQYPDAVFVVGACSTLAGGTDTESYRPFKDIFQTLTAETEVVAKSVSKAPDNARATKTLERTLEALLELGPDLIGLFVPAAGLLTKVGAYFADRKGWLKALTTKAEQPPAKLSQELIFEQFSRVILHLAARAPLVLIIDDLQWADRASLDLLFYLARRVTNEQLLLVGAYRPTDIQLDNHATPHPLLKVLHELQRYFGDIILDLNAATPPEGRAFIDALLDSEPNALDEAFRTWLFARTQGQALFTVEILRTLVEKKLFVRDADERWCLVGETELETLPDRVEAVIAERIERLRAGGLRLILDCGSVMGETFTAEVISRVEKVERRNLKLPPKTGPHAKWNWCTILTKHVEENNGQASHIYC